MRLFISHATKDRDIVDSLLDLLQLGIGVPGDEIFYSSRDGDIHNGAFFVQHIISALNAADLVICILSPAYFLSQFCLAEAGAAQARAVAKNCLFHSLIVPPATYRDLAGMLHGVQSGIVTDPAKLNELRDRIQSGRKTHVPTSTWESKRDAFLKAIEQALSLRHARKLVEDISIEDLIIERTSDPKITYKLKLRIYLPPPRAYRPRLRVLRRECWPSPVRLDRPLGRAHRRMFVSRREGQFCETGDAIFAEAGSLAGHNGNSTGCWNWNKR